MNRDKLVEIMNDEVYVESSQPIKGLKQAADRILATLAKEQGKEVVLWEGLVKTGEIGLSLFKGRGDNESTMLFAVDYKKLKGKTGTLIFREEVK